MMEWLNWPNRISIARILLIPAWVILLLNLNEGWPPARHAALGLYVVMALSDALDGFLARRWHQESALGRFLDPLADKLLTSCSVVILALDSTSVPGARLPSWVPVIALGKDVLTVMGFLVVYLATQQTVIRPRISGKACTMIQSISVAATLTVPDLPDGGWTLVRAMWIVASAVAVAAWLDYMGVGFRFVSEWQAKQSPPPATPGA